MFFKKQKSRKDICLSNSTLIALEIVNKVLNFIFQGKPVATKVHVDFKFLNNGNQLQPITKKDHLEVRASVLINHTFGCMNFELVFPIQSSGGYWEMVPLSDVEVKIKEIGKDFWLSCPQIGSLVWGSLYPTQESIQKILKNITLYFLTVEKAKKPFGSVAPNSKARIRLGN